eukprot:TRINITY_DN778130_c0_g1_i1.p1 TRINITY_DN778130_c0_g1~~TRINITY_DN778130_c0_g1_i1.p1  ORF type:complete len:447 (-),score=149.89 TRINITY_DN778130_c0_g1_i1:265-1605(-)
MSAKTDLEQAKVEIAVILSKEPQLFEDVIKNLFELEKKYRIEADYQATREVVLAINNKCYESQNWEALCTNLRVIAKRRQQLKQVIVAMIDQSIEWIDMTPNEEIKIKLIEALRDVTEGKIFAEVQRAKVTAVLSKIFEANGDIEKASEVLQEVQVETIGALELDKKVDYILDQMRLCLIRADYVRGRIIAGKVQTKFLEREGFEVIRKRYFKQMIELDLHARDTLSLAKHNFALYETLDAETDNEEKIQCLTDCIIFVILSGHDPEQSTFVKRLLDNHSDGVHETGLIEVIRAFHNYELVPYPVPCSDILQKNHIFADNESNTEGKIYDSDSDLSFSQLLLKRTLQHNVRVIHKYFSRIHLSRFCELLHCEAKDLELLLIEMVGQGSLYCKINRATSSVDFRPPMNSAKVLDTWSNKVSELLGLVEKTTHLVHKEDMRRKQQQKK